MKPNDYVIAQQKDTKPFLIRVSAIDDKTFTGVLEHDRHKNFKEIEVTRKDVVVNLGPEPKSGKVYGIEVGHRYVKSFTHDGWGSIHFYTRLDKPTLKMFQRSLDRTYKVVEKLKLDGYIDKIETEICEKKGKWAGKYFHKPEGLCTIQYAPMWCEGNAEAMDYVVLHEFGHVLRYHGMKSMKLRSAWLKFYQKSIAPMVVSNKQTSDLWKEMLRTVEADADASFHEAIKAAADDEDKEDQVKVIMRWFKQVNHLSPKDLSVLWAAGDIDHLKDLWPKTAIDSSKLAPLISEYATKNCEETIAESFAYYATGKKIPKSCTALLERSLSVARRSGGDTED